MTRETILYISDQATCSDSVSVALEAAGYEVVSTKSTMQAIALLFILHPVAAAVLHSREGEPTSLDVATSLRAVRPDVSDRCAVPRPDRPLAAMRGCLRKHQRAACKPHLRIEELAHREAGRLL